MNKIKFLFLILVSLVLYSCGQTSGVAPSLEQPSTTTPPSASPDALSISPSTLDTLVGQTEAFTAAGGTPPYSYSVFSGVGSILSLTGNYTASALAGSAVVRVTDSLGQFADAVVTIHDNLQILPLNPSLYINGSQTFSTLGGLPPVTYSVLVGVGSVDPATGVYSAPGVAGTATIRATDALGNTADSVVSVFNGLGISPTSASISINSSTTFSAAGGALPYTYSILTGGGSINASTGVYTAPALVGVVVVRVTDALGSYADSNISIINQAPVISNLLDQVINEDEPLSFGFTITDVDSSLNCATSMSAASSNGSLLPVSAIVFSGTAPNCTAVLTPALNLSGASSITFSVTDGVSTTSNSFNLNVNAVNDAPVISAITAQTVNEDTALVVNFSISDVDSTLNCVTSMTANTSNALLIPVAGIIFSGTAPNCTATISPLLNQNGLLNLTFRVSDGALFADQTFSVNVLPINDAPVISSISAQSVKTDASLVVNYNISDVDNTLDCSSSVSLSSGNTAVVPLANIVKSGTAPNCVLTITPSLNVAGTSAISVVVSDGSLTATSNFNLSTINVTGLAVTPSVLGIAVSGVSALTARATYSDSSTAVVSASSLITWTSSAPSIATVNTSGTLTGVAAGTANISAAYKGVSSNTAAITVIAASSLTVSTGAVTGGVGSQATVTATAQNSVLSYDVTSSALWTSSNNAVATVSNGVISYLSAGSAVITASYAGLTATVNVTVTGKSLVSLALSVAAGGSSVALNGTQKLVATATYSDASTEDVTQTAVWSSSNTSVLSVSNTLPNVGKVTGLAAGTSTVSAVVGSLSANILLTVNSVTISSIAISPYDALVTSNASYSLKATATYSDASTSDVTDLVTWSSSNSSAASISNTVGTKGVATTPSFTGYQLTTITATLGAVTGTTPFGVNGATVTSILVTPTVTIIPNQTYQLKAYANLSDGGTIDLSEFAIWSSSSLSNVSVSNSAGSKGMVTGIANGTSTVTATFSGVNGTRVVTVGASASTTEIGSGLLGSYYIWTGGTPPASPFLAANKKGQRIDAQVNYNWAAGNAPMGVGNQFAVRWTGYYKATASTNYFCTYSDDGARVWINGVQVINNWTEHSATWNCSSNIALTVGTKYSVVMEFYENGGDAVAYLTRSSVSAADAQNTSRAIIQSDLYPQ